MKYSDINVGKMDPDMLQRVTDQVFSFPEFEAKIKSGKPMRIKYGVDVTAPFMHIGHAVNLWFMRYLQEFGHKVVFLIGDFTTRIGDPTGKSQTRPIIPQEEINKNADAFIEQISKIILTDPDVFEVRRNSEWFDKMSVSDFLGLLSMVTHSQLISRDMFQKRIEENKEIYMHEMLYPILQGYDSYMLNSDITIVGSDQLFNEMMGRTYQDKLGQKPQIVITTRITPGTDGKEKQSKSIGNYIAITDTPRDQFGKVMSLPDELIIPYFEVYTTVDLDVIKGIKEKIDGGENPMIAKKQLACAIVARYYGDETAKAELEWFENAFSKKETPDDIPEIAAKDAGVTVMDLIQTACPDMSKSQTRRLLEQGAIKINDETISNENDENAFTAGDVLKVGKRRWFKII